MRVTVEPRGGRLDGEVGHARRRWRERRSWLVTLEDEDGAWGQGECSPLPGYSTEGPDEVEAALAGLARGLARGLGSSEPASVRCAMTMARLDLQSRRQGRTVAELLAPRPRETVEISGLLQSEPGEGLLLEVERLVRLGYRTLKWKAGRDGRWADERAWIRALREQQPDLALRLDINQSWTQEEARTRLPTLAELGVALVEEPCPPPFPPSPLPLAADESLRAGLPLEALGPVSALVLKPMALGVERCLTLAEEAARRGMGALVTHLFDGPLALAFGVELARALPSAPLACGLAPHAGLSAWGGEDVAQIHGALGIAAGPGLSRERR